MKRAFFKTFFAVMPLIGVFGAASPASLAEDVQTCCSTCDSGNGCHRGGYCYCCRKICEFRLIDDNCKCAWRRTWYGPYALATPLRQYYVPRPPEFSNCDGYAAGYVLGNFPATESLASTDPAVSPSAAAGFSPGRFERLGEIRNELDVVGAVGTPASSPAAKR